MYAPFDAGPEAKVRAYKSAMSGPGARGTSSGADR